MQIGKKKIAKLNVLLRKLSLITKIRVTSHRFGLAFWLLCLVKIIVLVVSQSINSCK
jgi:hypothetical protein